MDRTAYFLQNKCTFQMAFFHLLSIHNYLNIAILRNATLSLIINILYYQKNASRAHFSSERVFKGLKMEVILRVIPITINISADLWFDFTQNLPHR